MNIVGGVRRDILDYHDEYVFSVDLLVEAFGVRLQGEYAYRYIDYLAPSVSSEDTVRAAALGASEIGSSASHYGHGAYVLLSYALPLKRWIGSWRITPYLGYEYFQDPDYDPRVTMWRAGLNVRPLPALVFKAQWEGLYSEVLGDFHKLTLQMAVAF
jgi:hypothetical protein